MPPSQRASVRVVGYWHLVYLNVSENLQGKTDAWRGGCHFCLRWKPHQSHMLQCVIYGLSNFPLGYFPSSQHRLNIVSTWWLWWLWWLWGLQPSATTAPWVLCSRQKSEQLEYQHSSCRHWLVMSSRSGQPVATRPSTVGSPCAGSEKKRALRICRKSKICISVYPLNIIKSILNHVTAFSGICPILS